MLEIEVKSWKEDQCLCRMNIDGSYTIGHLKNAVSVKTGLNVNRQVYRRNRIDKSTYEDELILNNCFPEGKGIIYLKDLGRQISWTLVFIFEYLGALISYVLTAAYLHNLKTLNDVQKFALASWTLHYIKRLYETKYVHRFSHATMPLRNLFKNCFYYWGFGIFISYYVNNEMVTTEKSGLSGLNYFALILFVLCEIGNYSIHALLRDLRPVNSGLRKLPKPNGNLFTGLFKYVCCPNYTYEVGAWIAFSLMTGSYASALFTTCGFVQMAIWALQKHGNYRREFKDYKIPRAIIPGLL